MPTLQISESAKPARMTLQLPKTLDINLDLYCLATRQGRGEVLREALTEFLRSKDYNPDAKPEISYSWPRGEGRNGRRSATASGAR